MSPTKLKEFLTASIRSKRRVLVKGKPGIGKSDIVSQAASDAGADIVMMHPAISDPTDFKGLPALTGDGTAHFLPFGDLTRLVKADRPTVAFLDDIGQASPAVQAALMQLVLARRVNGTRISDHVSFVGATNDVGQMSAVAGMIEPLKSRWDTIVELMVSVDDWSAWALDTQQPFEVVAFLRFRPALLSDFKPCKGMTNSPSPRGWASVCSWIKDGVQDVEVFTGAVGQGAATEFYAFLDLQGSLPSLDAILLDPSGSPVPAKPAAMFAVSAGLARKATTQNLERVTRYLSRLPKEFEVMSIRDAVRINPGVTSCQSFVAWSVKNAQGIL